MAKKSLGQERYPFGKPEDGWLVVVVRPERAALMGYHGPGRGWRSIAKRRRSIHADHAQFAPDGQGAC